MFSLTVFKNLYDNKTDKRIDFKSWGDFEDLLYSLSKRDLADKKEAELISPAVFASETTRANKNVTEWAGWCAVDVDDHKFEGDIETALRNRYGKYYFVCYSTASSTIDHPKFRLVFPLQRAVVAAKIRHFWFALNTQLDSIGDKQTKDLSRMYFTPANYSGSNSFIFTNMGDLLSPDSIMDAIPYVEKTGNSFLDNLSPEMQRQVLEYKRSKLTNTDISWSGYNDCPFFPKKLAVEYLNISTGWYHKMYQIMVAIASSALKSNYPITSVQIAILCKQFDKENGNWYENRPMERESQNALEYAYRNAV